MTLSWIVQQPQQLKRITNNLHKTQQNLAWENDWLADYCRKPTFKPICPAWGFNLELSYRPLRYCQNLNAMPFCKRRSPKCGFSIFLLERGDNKSQTLDGQARALRRKPHSHQKKRQHTILVSKTFLHFHSYRNYNTPKPKMQYLKCWLGKMIGSASNAVRDNSFAHIDHIRLRSYAALRHNKIIVPPQQKYETKQEIARRFLVLRFALPRNK